QAGEQRPDAAGKAAPGQAAGAGPAEGAKPGAGPAEAGKPAQAEGAKPGAGPAKSAGAKGGPAPQISAEKKTKIRESVVNVGVKPVDVDVNVSVGVAVPRTVTLHPLPPTIISLVPEYEGYQFFLLPDGTIVIVDPTDYLIVTVISA
ncbi:DUF1236 domain-containing protein, partial [Propylenella binzhouense]